METHALPGARFVDPKVLARGSRTWSCSRAMSWTASSTGCTARRTSARRSTSPSTGATCRATTSGAWTGSCTRAPTATTSSSTRRTRTPTSRCCSTSRSRWASRAAASRKLQYGSFLAASLAYLSHRQRDRVGIITFDEDIVTHVPPSAKHFNVLLHTLDRAQGGAARDACMRDARQDGGALQAPLDRRADFRSLREPRRT